MKKKITKKLAFLFALLLLATYVIPVTVFAVETVKATSAKISFTTTYTVSSVNLHMTDGTNTYDLECKKQGSKWVVKDEGTDVTAAISGVTVNFNVGGTIVPVYFPASELSMTPEGSGGSGTINISLGEIAPPPAPQSTLTVYYKIDGTDPAQYLTASPDTFTQDVGTTRTVTAGTFSGYTLKTGEASSYTHTYGENDYTYTFLYVEVPDTPERRSTPKSTLTVYYKIDGTDPAEYLTDNPNTYTQSVGSTRTVAAPSFEGYILKDGEAASYTHTYGSGDYTYTFLYVEEIEIIEVPEPEIPLAEPEITAVPVEALPETGGLAPEFFYLGGVSMISAGIWIRKRKPQE